MNLIRIIVIIILVSLLVIIRLWTKRQPKQLHPQEQQMLKDIDNDILSDKHEPSLDFSDLDGMTATGESNSQPSNFTVANKQLLLSKSSSSNEKLIILNLMAPIGRLYSGIELLTAIQGANLVYGEMNIFHHLAKKCSKPIFSMANMIEPGIFEPPFMDKFFTPGVTFFMNLPNQIDGSLALELMLKSINYLAEELGGEICDYTHKPINHNDLAKLKQDVLTYQQRINK